MVRSGLGHGHQAQLPAVAVPQRLPNNLYTANKAGNPAPCDLISIEETVLGRSRANGVTQGIFSVRFDEELGPVDKRFKRSWRLSTLLTANSSRCLVRPAAERR